MNVVVIGLEVINILILDIFLGEMGASLGIAAQDISFPRSSSFTCCGFALPCVAFITWPTR